jgi:hypothetical protein
MPDYSHGKIYKIWSDEGNVIYYGSTVVNLSQRIVKHRSNYKRYCKDAMSIGFCSSFLILKYDDYKYELIKKYPTETRKELNKEEGKHIIDNNSNKKCVNIVIAGREHNEWVSTYPEKIREYRVKLRAKRRQLIIEGDKKEINRQLVRKQYNKKWNDGNKESQKIKQREYKIKNKEHIKKKDLEYYSKNKDLIKKKAIVKHVCECGATMRYDSRFGHKKSKKHLAYTLTLV